MTATRLGLMALGLALLGTAPCAALLLFEGAPLAHALFCLTPLALAYLAGTAVGRHTVRALAPCHASLRALEARQTLTTPAEGELGQAISALAERIDEERTLRARKRCEAEAAAKKQSQVLADILHDLRTPLHAVLGFTELLERGVNGELSPAQMQSVRTIGDSGRRLLIRVHEVFDTALLDVGRLDLIVSPTLAVDLVEQALQEIRLRYASATLDTSIRLETGLPPLRVDPYRIVQAITYLLAYGIEATPEQDRPKTATRAILTARMKPNTPERALELSVSVPSAVVDEAERAHALDGPRHAPSRPSQKALGLGLGPYLARRFVELHGGHIVVATPAPGVRFEITLPQA